MTGTRSGFRMKTTARSSAARSRQILEMTCLRFSLIKLKCENHTQMSVGQFGFWPHALLSGFYGIFYVSKRQFFFSRGFFAEKIIPKLFFPAKFQHVRSKNLPPYFKLQSNRYCLLNPAVPSHSVADINRPPHCLPRLSVCLPSLSLSLFSSVSLSLGRTRRLMAI